MFWFGFLVFCAWYFSSWLDWWVFPAMAQRMKEIEDNDERLHEILRRKPPYPIH